MEKIKMSLLILASWLFYLITRPLDWIINIWLWLIALDWTYWRRRIG